MELADWFSEIGRQDCETCRRAFTTSKWDSPEAKKAKASGPPCATCRPPVMPENAAAEQMYIRVSDQWEMGPGGPVGIRMEAIEASMRMYRIPRDDRADLADKLLVIGRRISKARSQKVKSDAQSRNSMGGGPGAAGKAKDRPGHGREAGQ